MIVSTYIYMYTHENTYSTLAKLHKIKTIDPYMYMCTQLCDDKCVCTYMYIIENVGLECIMGITASRPQPECCNSRNAQ